MTIDRLINVLVTVTFIEMMVALGLGVTFAELACVARDWRLVTRASLANYACVPAVAVGLLLLFDANPMVAAGFLVLATCPGAPYGPPFTAIARGNLAVSTALMVILAGSSTVVAPFLLHALLPLVSEGGSLRLDVARMVGTLLMAQLAPLGIGLAVRQWYPTSAARLRDPAERACKVLNLVTVGLILVVQLRTFAAIRPIGYAGMLAMLVASLTSGWLAGGPVPEVRKAVALATSLRNVGVGLVITTGSFAGTPAVSTALAYGIVQTFGSLLLSMWWGRRAVAAGDTVGVPAMLGAASDSITVVTKS